MSMTQTTPETPAEPPRGHVRVVYLGPVAPHWEVESEFGDRILIEGFRERALGAGSPSIHPWGGVPP